MMVHRTGGTRGGNLEVERQITQLGKTRKQRRIRRSLESSDVKLLRRAHTTIDKLVADQRWDVLRAYRDGDLSTSDLLAADRKGKASRSLAGIRLQQFLWDRIVATASGDVVTPGAISKAMIRVKGKSTRNRYLQSFRSLQEKAGIELSPDACVIDLLTAVDWDDLYDRWGTSNADWMHLRRSLSRFATLHTGDKWSRFARKLRAIVPTKKVKKRRPNLTIEQFKAVVASAPAHAAAAYWVLAATGVRVGEYLASTRASLNKPALTYLVPGAAKNSVGDFPLRVDARWWPYLERGIPSRLRYKWLRIYWVRAREAAGVGTVTLHDLRHCHGQWAINAKVDESKVQGSLRHESPAQTRDYTMQAGTIDVSAALADGLLGQATEPRRRKA